MEIHQLTILRELGALGSVTAVAEALHVSPSAVSQHLAALQRQFATPLTRREGRVLTLTDAGVELARAGAGVIDAMAAAQSAVEEFEDRAGGTVTLSSFHSAGQAVFGPLLRELGTGRPDSPDLRLADEDVAQSDFPALTAQYDLVLAHRMEHSPPWPGADLHVVHLAREPLDVALPAAHPLARRRTLRPRDVIGERWVTSRVGYSPDDVLTAVAALASRPAEVVHRVNDYGAVAALVAAGSGIGLLPRYTSPHPYDDVVLRPLHGLSTSRTIDVLARPETLRRRSVQVVVRALRVVMERLVASTG
ncbi:LysR family transcriptional regulator [Pimelobacter simplex]|uniref:Chromosome initiation inhibitor n=1 Tax=Nocardioides simplex TaxID=2045 RepID=A0A0A1DMM1_NOCSI|nr:LysR family transcriptional regulator [Pimelobacter simplex]AIY18594.1 Chromosome initiation inhibitor [Pimelobacter simplex]MCG8153223.1 LysR family transcriptional regulator [Pimelobacter simplex]GEB14239.1 LysR family transcriptional regulator [Pimelobacter simplex]SFM32025.1 DNA-binding transcriptional regulator, LysR family [Pimelobacter simplex]